MKIAMHEVMNLSELYNKLKVIPLPIKTGYKIAMFFSEIEKQQKFYMNSLNKIIDKYAEKDEIGQYIFADAENIKIEDCCAADCQQELADLSNLEIEITGIEGSIEELGDIKLNLDEIITLNKIFCK